MQLCVSEFVCVALTDLRMRDKFSHIFGVVYCLLQNTAYRESSLLCLSITFHKLLWKKAEKFMKDFKHFTPKYIDLQNLGAATLKKIRLVAQCVIVSFDGNELSCL
jgi:hypothetical protein